MRRGCAPRAQAAAVRLNGEAEATAVRAVGGRESRRLQAEHGGASAAAGYTAIQLATILGEHNVKLVRDRSAAATAAAGWSTR